MEFFATAARGTDSALYDELRELGLGGVKTSYGGVAFAGEREDGWRACLYSRIAQRIQMPLARFAVVDEASLYAGVRAIDWSPYLTPRLTLAVSAFCHSSALTHSGFIALKTKDAIVDQFRDACGERPSVSRDDPDVRIFVHLVQNGATVYLDLAGLPLFKRGYRGETGEAPLKETLAAAMLRLAGWDRRQPLVDPMCGSGTIAIEAAMWAGAIAPGILRPRFGFERWACHDADAARRMAELRGEARSGAHGQAGRILASDVDVRMVELARTNARAAGVRIAFREAPLAELQPAATPFLVVSNPPYGMRLEADAPFFRDMAAAFSRLHGCRVALLAGTPEILKAMPLRPTASHTLFNGDIECRFVVYDVP